MAADRGVIRGLPPGFLEASRGADDNRSTPEPRRGCSVEPLVDACATYDALERALLEATTSIWIAHWSFDPIFDTQSAAARGAHVVTWTALLTDAVERGVSVRILINDFDPVVEYSWHLEAWQAYRHLLKAADEAAAGAVGFDRARFQVLVSMHPAQLGGPLVGALSAWQLGDAIADLNQWAADESLESAAQALDLMPGLWSLVSFDASATPPFARRGAGARPVSVASHHQKLCIVDGRSAFLGGIDIGPDLISNGRHEANPFRHDVHFRITGPVVDDLARIFRARWNEEGPAARAAIAEYNTHAPRLLMPTSHFDAIPRLDPIAERTATTVAQVIHTRTGAVREAPAPEPHRLDTEACVKAALESAEQFVYIENQYLRWPVIVDWLLEARRVRRDLRVIVVVPFTPEEAGDPASADPVTLHGMHLQHITLTRLVEKFGDKAGVFTLTSRVRASASPRKLHRCGHITGAAVHATPIVSGAPSVYVHSKVLIVDDWFALIGSANLDGRSFRVDSELGIAWHHPAEIIRLRLTLWHEHLGPDLDLRKLQVHEFLPTWWQRALRHTFVAPKDRPGLVVPYPFDSVPKGSESPFDARLMSIMARGVGDETAGYPSRGLERLRSRRGAAVS